MSTNSQDFIGFFVVFLFFFWFFLRKLYLVGWSISCYSPDMAKGHKVFTRWNSLFTQDEKLRGTQSIRARGAQLKKWNKDWRSAQGGDTQVIELTYSLDINLILSVYLKRMAMFHHTHNTYHRPGNLYYDIFILVSPHTTFHTTMTLLGVGVLMHGRFSIA